VKTADSAAKQTFHVSGSIYEKLEIAAESAAFNRQRLQFGCQIAAFEITNH
jgi:hypothetical protein